MRRGEKKRKKLDEEEILRLTFKAWITTDFQSTDHILRMINRKMCRKQQTKIPLATYDAYEKNLQSHIIKQILCAVFPTALPSRTRIIVPFKTSSFLSTLSINIWCLCKCAVCACRDMSCVLTQSTSWNCFTALTNQDSLMKVQSAFGF